LIGESLLKGRTEGKGKKPERAEDEDQDAGETEIEAEASGEVGAQFHDGWG
jgi:hypothetical protein